MLCQFSLCQFSLHYPSACSAVHFPSWYGSSVHVYRRYDRVSTGRAYTATVTRIFGYPLISLYKTHPRESIVSCRILFFVVSCVSQTYLGCGRTKRKARMEAATRAILSSIQFPDSYVTHDVIQPYLPRSIDFTADSFHDDWSTTTMAAEVTTDPLERSDETASNVNARRIPDLTEVPWNPVSILNDIRPQSRYHRISSPGGSSDRKWIRISVTFDGMTFDGVGRCQRSAKQRAAQAALKDYFNLRFIGSVRPPKALPSSSSNTPTIPQGTHPRAH